MKKETSSNVVEFKKKSEFFSNEAEQNVLGAILMSQEKLTEVIPVLQLEDFYIPEHRKIYAKMIDLLKSGMAIDLTTVTIDSTVEVAYLGEIGRNTASSIHLDTYVKIVKKKAIERHAIGLLRACIEQVGKVDTESLFLTFQKQAMQVLTSEMSEKTYYASKVLPDVLEEMMKPQDKNYGVSTGLPALDAIVNRLNPGEVTIIAGKPGSGKSALATNIAADVVVQQKKIALIFSLEMTYKEIMKRFVSCIANVSSDKLKNVNAMSDHDWDKVNLAVRMFSSGGGELIIDNTSQINQFKVQAIAMREKLKHGKLDLLVIDYLGLMDHGDSKENKTDRIGNTTAALKRLAQELDVPILLLSQVNRGIDHRSEKEPILSDLRDSGNIEQDADRVIFVYSDGEEGLRTLKVAKQRNGSLGLVRVQYQGNKFKFEELKN